MKTATIPHKAPKGLIAQIAISCRCPDTGIEGSFLFSGETWRAKGSRVSPVYDDLAELFPAVCADWEQIVHGYGCISYIKR